MNRPLVTQILVAVALLNAVTCLQAQDEARARLAGLPGVAVAVEELDEETKRAGLSEASLRTMVESQLRKSGIRVLYRDEWLATPGRPAVYVIASALPVGDAHAYSVEFALYEVVRPVRDVGIAAPAVTWNTGRHGLTPWLPEEVRGTVEAMVEDFASAVLAENPKG